MITAGSVFPEKHVWQIILKLFQKKLNVNELHQHEDCTNRVIVLKMLRLAKLMCTLFF